VVPESDETNNSSSLSLSLVPPSVDVGVILAATPDPATVGAHVAYTAAVANTGPDTAHGVTLTIPVPSGATYVSAAATQGWCDTLGDTVECILGALASGAQSAATLTVRPDAPGVLRATATVRRNEPDANATNDSATTATQIGAAGLSFHTLQPCRLVDTRNPVGPRGGPTLVADQVRTFSLAGACGVPSSARALALNVTVVGPTGAGHITLFPGGNAIPLASTVNFAAGAVRGNNATLALSGTGELSTFSTRDTHLVIDVYGYFE
jgi:uncharacterized repeat protein (TIGR01451 family)